jgi:hypothetical protein
MLEVDKFSQTLLAVNKLVGDEFTVTNTVVAGDVQTGVPGFTTLSVIVFVPGVDQLNVCEPTPTGLPPIQPPQFQL